MTATVVAFWPLKESRRSLFRLGCIFFIFSRQQLTQTSALAIVAIVLNLIQ